MVRSYWVAVSRLMPIANPAARWERPASRWVAYFSSSSQIFSTMNWRAAA